MVGGLLGLLGGGVQHPLRVGAGPAQQRLRLRTGVLGLLAEPPAGLLGEPLRLGAGRREGLLGLGAGLVEEALGLRLGAGPELFGPGDVLVDVGLDGGAALGQLLVELLAPVDRLGVQLRLEAGLLLGVLLEDALGLGPHLAQLALGVAAHLVGLELGVPQHLLGLVAEVRGVVGVGTRRQRPSGLVQLGTQNLDLVAEVLGVLNGLLPVGLQPVHLGFEPREVVVSSVALLAFVAPHCAVPSVPWSRKLRTTPSADGRGSRGKWCQTARGPGLPPGAAALKPGPRPGGRPRGSDGRPPTLPANQVSDQCSADSSGAEVTSSVSTPWQSLGCRKVIRDPMEPFRGSS